MRLKIKIIGVEPKDSDAALTIPERPGRFERFCGLLSARSIAEFNYRLGDPQRTYAFVGLSTHNRDETAQLVRRLREAGLPTEDLSDNEMAKPHLRHSVSRRASQVSDELVYRFQFPRPPGALMNLFERVSQGRNISLFHSRNHGAEFVRALVGMQLPGHQLPAVGRFPSGLNYRFWNESGNPA